MIKEKNPVTPHEGKIKRGTIIPPKKGCKDDTFYVVELAFSSHNIIHNGIFFSGIVKNGNYQFIITSDGDVRKIMDLYYMKVVREIEMY